MKSYITATNPLSEHFVISDGVAHDLPQEVKDADLLRQFVPMTVRDPQLTRHHYAPPPKGPTTR